jgi:N-acetylneuraminic acid mutarotase
MNIQLNFNYLLNSFNPSARNGSSCWNIDNNYLYLFGGAQDENIFNDFYMYDLKKEKWIIIDIECPPPRFGSIFFHIDNYLVLMGGFSNENTTLNDIWYYDISNKKWIKKETPANLIIGTYASYGVFNNKVYIFGGIAINNKLNICNTMYIYDFLKNEITGIELDVEKSPEIRFNSNYWIYNINNVSYMYLMDGLTYKANELNQLNDTWRFNLNTECWEKIDLLPNNYKARNSCLIFKNNNFVYLFGGIDANNIIYNDIYQLNLIDNKIEEITQYNTLPEFRSDSAVWIIKDKFYFFGGIIEGNHSNDMWLLKIKKNKKCCLFF